jgi:hypothetical protein
MTKQKGRTPEGPALIPVAQRSQPRQGWQYYNAHQNGNEINQNSYALYPLVCSLLAM